MTENLPPLIMVNSCNLLIQCQNGEAPPFTPDDTMVQPFFWRPFPCSIEGRTYSFLLIFHKYNQCRGACVNNANILHRPPQFWFRHSFPYRKLKIKTGSLAYLSLRLPLRSKHGWRPYLFFHFIKLPSIGQRQLYPLDVMLSMDYILWGFSYHLLIYLLWLLSSFAAFSFSDEKLVLLKMRLEAEFAI
jgi:hypothetical protein